MSDSLRILLLDDNPNDRAWTAAALQQEFAEVTILPAANADGFASALDGGAFDLAVIEYTLHWGNGLQALARLRESRPLVPVIMFTSGGNEEMAVEGMKAGLTDYIPKTPYNLPRLIHSVRASVEHIRTEEALRESRRILDTLIGNLPGMVYRSRNDDQGTLLFVSEGSVELTGYPPDDLVLNRKVAYRDLIHPDDRELVDREIRKAVRENSPFQMTYRIRTAAGSDRWVWEHGCGVYGEQNEFVAMEGFVSDITERRRAEEEVRENNRKLSTLSAISRVIAFSRTPEELAEALVRELRRVFRVDAFYMEGYQTDTGRGLGIGDYDTIDGVFRRVPYIRSELDLMRGPLGRPLFQFRKPVLINRTPEERAATHPRLVAFGDTKRRSASLVYIPLIVAERIIGIMSVQSYTPNAFGEKEVELLTAIGGQVAPAIEGVLLSHNLLRNSETIRSIVTGTSATTGADFFRSLVRHLASAFGVRYALLGEFAGTGHDRIRTRAVWDDGTYLDNFEFDLARSFFQDMNERRTRFCSRAAREQYPDDPLLERFGVESCMGIALCDSSDAVLGVLEVLHTDSMDENLELESVLKVFAARAGAELERIRVEEALRNREEKYRDLFENALVGMFRTRLTDGLILEANQRMAELAGFPSREEYVNRIRAIDTYVDPGTRERMVRIIEEQGEVNNFEARVQRNDGKVVWLQYSAVLDREQGYLEGIAFDITRRKEAENALREANETLQAVVQASPLAIVGFGLDQRVLMWNPAAERIFGWSYEEAIDSQSPVISQLELDNFASVQKTQDGEKGFSGLELRRRRKDGLEIDISLSMASLRDSNGRVTGALAIISDITERKRFENERKALAWLSLQLVEADTLEVMADALVQSLGDLFQFDALYFAQRLPGQDVFQPVRAMDIVDGSRMKVPGTGHVLDDFRPLGRIVKGEPYLLNRQSDEELPLLPFGDTARRSASLMFAPVFFRGEMVGVLSVQSYERNRYQPRDLLLLNALTHMVAPALRRAQVESELRRSEARNRALLNAIPDLIFVMSADGIFRDYSAPREQLYLQPEQFLGKPIHEVLPRELSELTMSHVRKVLRSGMGRHFEYQLEMEGRMREFEARMVQCGTDEILVIIRDITDQKLLEAQLRQAQKMEAIGRLAGGIAHDFNNLLTGVIGNLGVAQMDAPPELQPILDEAMRAGQRASGLVSQLLAFGRKSLVSIQPADVGPILKEVVGIVRNTFDRRIEIMVRIMPGLRLVLGDPGQIHQILLNLLVNARDALVPMLNANPPVPLRIVLDADNFEAGEDYREIFSYARPGSYVAFSVTDTGIGMDEETRKHLFEPFFTTKELGKGTGLGLATIYGIVKQHNGWINVYSEPGQGSTFRVYLPAAEVTNSTSEAEKAAEKRNDVLPMPGGPETILVVDDEAFIRRLTRRILEPLGYVVMEASNGEEALHYFREHDNEIHLVLLDLSMPRMSGQETLTQLRRTEQQDVKVILSSGYAHVGDLPDQLGAVEYISKPYRPAELAQLIRKVLDT